MERDRRRSRVWVRWVALTLAAATLTTGGCGLLEDAGRWVANVPSRAEIKAVEADIAAKNAEVRELERKEADARAEILRLETAHESTERAAAQLSSVFASVAAQLSNASPEERPLIMEQLEYIRRRIDMVNQSGAAIASKIADWTDQTNRIASSVVSLNDELVDVENKLLSLLQETEEGVSRLTSGIRSTGQALSNYVPGAGAAAETVSSWIGGVFGTAIGGTGVATAAAIVGRRRKKELDGAREIIETNEKLDIASLLPEKWKKSASDQMSENAKAVLKRITNPIRGTLPASVVDEPTVVAATSTHTPPLGGSS